MTWVVNGCDLGRHADELHDYELIFSRLERHEREHEHLCGWARRIGLPLDLRPHAIIDIRRTASNQDKGGA